MDRNPSDDELLAAAATDVEAFGVFYRRHADAILAYARSRTGEIETAADLTADVFAAAFAARGRYQPNREPARAWLIGIANNLVALSRRRRWRAVRARARLAVPAISWVDEELERAEERLSARLNRGLVTALTLDVPPHEREAVMARIVDEKEYPEIAREQGCSESAVRKRVSRGLRRLGLALEKERP